MKPVDPRLLRSARAARLFLVISVLLGLMSALLVIAQAMLIAEVVVGAFQHRMSAGALVGPLVWLAVVAAGRGTVAWLTELSAHRASAAVKSELRTRLLAHGSRVGVEGPADRPTTGQLTTLVTRGVDALDDYFASYLPQLGLAVVVPVAVLVRMVTADWVSAVLIALTLPLIPLFMALIGWVTQARMDRQWRLLARLSHHFLDVVAGLPTLRVFGRATAQAASIRAITADYRRATLRALRIAFLSSFALELLATLSVALVAVGVGMRLVRGEMDLYTGLVVLILAPEAYLPLRQVGTHYHAAAEGLAAADEVFAVLEGTPRSVGTAPAPDMSNGVSLSVRDLSVRYPGRPHPAPDGLSLTVRPGETVALVGPSGAGKSTLLHTLLGLVVPTAGQVRVGDTDLAALSSDGWRAWRERIAWVPQRPSLFAGTVADNVRLARPEATDGQVRDALRRAGSWDFVADLPDGMATRVGEGGAGFSAGQRQRVALARAFLADRPVLLLDEPTANLDGETEESVVRAVRRLAVGRTVLLVVHRPALLGMADRVVNVSTPTAEDGTDTASVRAAPPRVGVVAAGPAPIPERGGTRPPSGDDPRPPRTPRAVVRGDGARRRPERGVDGVATLRAAGRAHRSRFVLALLLGSLALGSAVGLMAVSGWLISRASEQPPVLYLMVAVTATRAFGIGRAVFRYAERLVSHDAVLRVLADLRVAVYRRLERLAPAGLRDSRRGDLLARLVADVDTLQDYFLRWLLPVGSAVLVGGGAVLFTGWLLPSAGLVLLAGLLLAGVVAPAVSGLLARRTERRLAPARGTLTAEVVDVLAGTAELTVLGALGARLSDIRRADASLTRMDRRASAATAVGAGLSALSCGLTVVGVAWTGVAAVHAGGLDGRWLAVVVLLPLAAFEAVAGLPAAVAHRQRVRQAARRVTEVLAAPDPVPEKSGPGVEEAGPEVVAAGSSTEAARPVVPAAARAGTGSERYRAVSRPGPAAPTSGDAPPALVLRDVTARYPSRSAPPSTGHQRCADRRVWGVARDADEPPALSGVDLELAAGSRLAVVGTSGAGKSTLAQVLLRFLALESGTYLLHGRDATAMDGDAVRRQVGLCAQDAHVFDSSLRENLRLARPDADDEALREVLGRARLLDWVRTLPAGLATSVGEHGARLSGGQRQRLALARALLADFPVLILDEPAEHLDPPTADALTADLLTVTEGRSTVLITHRLAGLEAVDDILVLDGGRVVQRGRYDVLRGVEGPFRELAEREGRTEPTARLSMTNGAY